MNTSQWLGPYELQQCIEYTQQGEVWKAFDTEQRYYVCLYISRVSSQLAPGRVTQFFEKMQQVAALRHPNIVQVLDLCTVQMSTDATEQGVLVVTEYAEHQPLTGYIEAITRAGQLPTPQEIVHLLTPICSALDYVHQQGFVHGSIRPDSILLSDTPPTPDIPGMPRLINFYTHYVQPPLTLPLNASFYVAPEQVQGDLDNPRSDIYALGILLYELCTGTQPFYGDNPADVLMQHTRMTPPSPALIQPHLLPALTAVIVRCLSKDPSARFPTASAVMSAMAKALNMPVHDSSSQPGIQGTETHQHDPTVNSPRFLSPRVSASPPAMAALVSDQVTPPRPQSSRPTPTITPLSRSLPDVSTIRQPFTATSTTPPAQGKRQGPPRRYIIAVVLILAALAISTLGGYLIIRTNIFAPAAPIVGHAFFTNNGQYTPNSAQGIADVLQISMNNAPAPQAGQSYYFWLLADTDTAGVNFPPILLGNSKVGGNIKITYTDRGNRDLLANYSRFLVTEESSAMTPANPSLDTSTWHYFSQFSRTKNSQNGFSLLDHLRHLLAADPKLQQVGLHGGLDIWLYRDVLNVMILASSARDAQSGDTAFRRRQLVRILDYLDGSVYIRTEGLPPGLAPVEIDPTIARVALLEFDQLNQFPPGYIDHIGTHLKELVDSPGVTPEQKQLAIQIDNGLNNVQGWLNQVHTDARQLMHMSDAQLQRPAAQALFDDLYTQANRAFTGRFDPNTGQVQDGVSQIHAQDLQLATFDIQPYQATK